MKRPSTTFLVCLFPLLAPTLAFAHARPHPHPRANVAGEGTDLSQLQKLKRQFPVLNDTAPIETTSSSSTSSSVTLTSSDEPTSTTTSAPDLDAILSSIQSNLLGGEETSTSAYTTSKSKPTTAPGSTGTNNTTDEGAQTTTAPSDTADSTSAPETTTEDVPLQTTIPIPTMTSGLTTGLNTPSITVQPPIPIDTSTSSTDEPSTTHTRAQIPIIDTLSDILTSLFPDETTSSEATTTAEETTAAEPTTTADEPTSTSESASITESPSPTKTDLGDILSSILSGVTSIVQDVTTLPPNATDPVSTDIPDVTSVIDSVTADPTTTTADSTTDPVPTSEPTTVTALPTTDLTLIPTGTGVVLPTGPPTNSTTDPTSIVTDLPVTTSISLDPTATTSITDIPVPTSQPANSTVVLPTDTATTSLAPETTGGLGTVIPTETTVPSSTTDAATTPTEAATTTPTEAPPAPTDTQLPSGNLDTSSLWFGTSLVTQASTPVDGQNPPATTMTGLPSDVPEAITPPGGVPNEPNNSTLIQIGFTREYNYAFVSSSLESAAQICNFLPEGLADGLGVGRDELRMHTLQPLQPEGLDYIVTLGLVYIPTLLLPKLQSDIHIPLSGIYTNKNPTINAFMDTIDPSIPLIPGQNIALVPPSNTNGGSGGGGYDDPGWVKTGDNIVDGSEATSTAGVDQAGGADPYSSEGGSRNPVTSKQITIGVASFSAAALYGVAMYFLAKRYRNNRLSHRRSQSLTGGGIEPPPMSDLRSSGALSPMMSTNFFNNGRSTPAPSDKRGSKGSKTSASARGQISAPMMSENSLGWD